MQDIVYSQLKLDCNNYTPKLDQKTGDIYYIVGSSNRQIVCKTALPRCPSWANFTLQKQPQYDSWYNVILEVQLNKMQPCSLFSTVLRKCRSELETSYLAHCVMNMIESVVDNKNNNKTSKITGEYYTARCESIPLKNGKPVNIDTLEDVVLDRIVINGGLILDKLNNWILKISEQLHGKSLIIIDPQHIYLWKRYIPGCTVVANMDGLNNSRGSVIMTHHSFNKIAKIIGPFDNLVVDNASFMLHTTGVNSVHNILANTRYLQLNDIPSTVEMYDNVIKFMCGRTDIMYPLYDKSRNIKLLDRLIVDIQKQQLSTTKTDVIMTYDIFEQQLRGILGDDAEFNMYVNQFSLSKTRKDMQELLTKTHGSLEYINNIFKTKSCPICTEYIIHPVVTICGHIYCSSCLVASYKTNKSCPSCRQCLKLGDIYKIRSNKDKDKVDGCKNRAVANLLKKSDGKKWVIVTEQEGFNTIWGNCRIFNGSKKSEIDQFNRYSGSCNSCCIVSQKQAKRVFNPDCVILWDEGLEGSEFVSRDRPGLLHQYILRHPKQNNLAISA